MHLFNKKHSLYGSYITIFCKNYKLKTVPQCEINNLRLTFKFHVSFKTSCYSCTFNNFFLLYVTYLFLNIFSSLFFSSRWYQLIKKTTTEKKKLNWMRRTNRQHRMKNINSHNSRIVIKNKNNPRISLKKMR